MCGIFGYIGGRTNAGTVVLEGLQKLEYRGYDSWGVAMEPLAESAMLVGAKRIGMLPQVSSIPEIAIPSARAMGHTRWATHGGVTDANAHPHYDTSQRIAVVHNGIIDNYEQLRKELQQEGVSFKSDTDSEIIPHLIRKHLDAGMQLPEAVRTALAQIEGRYAVVVMMHGADMMIAARRGSPLIIGVGEHEYFIASDIPAFLPFTNVVNYLDDNEMLIATSRNATYIDLQTGTPVQKRNITIHWAAEEAEKGDIPHFMLKEIREQKETIRRTMNQDAGVLESVTQAIREAYGVFFVGCGTAGKVCLAASYAFSEIAQRHVNVVFGSEFRSYHHFLKPGGLLIAISQSGETADTLEAIEVAKSKGLKIISIVNVESSTMARMSDFVLPLKVGPEKAVASTKATTAQLALVIMLAYHVAGKAREGQELLLHTASAINDMLNPRYEEHIMELARKLQNTESMYVIGKAINYPMALEAAIKIQEVSYIHAEGFAGGELKHGPLALIGAGTPAIALVANDETKRDILSNAMEIKSRGGFLIGVSPERHAVFDYWVKVPDCAGPASAIVNIIPLQMLAYHLSILRGNDPDHPRNLAKAVTVK